MILEALTLATDPTILAAADPTILASTGKDIWDSASPEEPPGFGPKIISAISMGKWVVIAIIGVYMLWSAAKAGSPSEGMRHGTGRSVLMPILGALFFVSIGVIMQWVGL